MAQTLTHSPAHVLSKVLIDLGLGVAVGSTPWPVNVAGEPDTPDEVITVYDTQGSEDGRSMIDGELWGHAGVQVRVRARDHKTGWTKADAIQTGLAKNISDEMVTIEGQRYLIHSANKIGDVLALGNESPTSKRKLFTLNCLLSLKQF